MRRWRNTECSKCSGLAPFWRDSFEPELKQIIQNKKRKIPNVYPETAGPLEAMIWLTLYLQYYKMEIMQKDFMISAVHHRSPRTSSFQALLILAGH